MIDSFILKYIWHHIFSIYFFLRRLRFQRILRYKVVIFTIAYFWRFNFFILLFLMLLVCFYNKVVFYFVQAFVYNLNIFHSVVIVVLNQIYIRFKIWAIWATSLRFFDFLLPFLNLTIFQFPHLRRKWRWWHTSVR